MHNKQPGAILTGVIPYETTYTFCMCNPPFFAAETGSSRPALNNLAISSQEALTKGGELQFVRQIINDSCVFREKVH